MTITTAKTAAKCMAGGCKNRAAIEISTERPGIRSRLRLCDECAAKLYAALGGRMIPKSYETVARRKPDEKPPKGV